MLAARSGKGEVNQPREADSWLEDNSAVSSREDVRCDRAKDAAAWLRKNLRYIREDMLQCDSEGCRAFVQDDPAKCWRGNVAV